MSEFETSKEWKELFAAARNADPKMVFSPSKMADFQTCPRQYYAKHVSKEVVFQETIHTKKGKDQHKQLENRLLKGTPLPADLQQVEGTCQHILKLGKVRGEFNMGINADLSNGSFFGKGANLPMLRMILDVTATSPDGKRAWVFDWKTGKVKDDVVQVSLNCLGIFAESKAVQRVRGAYVWTTHEQITPYENGGSGMYKTRDDIPALVSILEKGTIPIMVATINDEFEPNKNYLCEKYCDVKACSHHGKPFRS